MYYIDGYNLLFRLRYHHRSLQEGRSLIIRELNEKLAAIGREATIVFDSQYTEGESGYGSHSNLYIIFTAAKETADDWLLAMLKRASKPQIFTIVTSDRGLIAQIHHMGGKGLSIEAFIHWLNKKQKPMPAPKFPAPSIDYYLKIFEERFRSNN